MRPLLLFSALILVFSSCERDADIPLPEVDPTMALSCFISPGQPIEARLLRVNPVFQSGNPGGPDYITGGTVWISNGTDTSWLVEDMSGLYYREAVPQLVIAEGKTYWMGAASAGLPTVFAKCTVPRGKVTQWQVSFSTSPRGADSSYRISLAWNDRPNEDNFYRILCIKEDSGINSVSRNLFNFGTEYYNDKGRDGNLVSSMVGEILQPGSSAVVSRYISSYLVTCDLNYFRYHLSLESYTEGSPFGDPASIYSNVVNGSGCFGAYIQQHLEKKVF